MEEHKYRGQIIQVITTVTPGTDYWIARADIAIRIAKDFDFSHCTGLAVGLKVKNRPNKILSKKPKNTSTA
jgi:hypothetical protein